MDFQGLALFFFWRSSQNRQNFTIYRTWKQGMPCSQREFFVFCMSYKVKERFIYITLLKNIIFVTWLSPTLGAFSALFPSPGRIRSSEITNLKGHGNEADFLGFLHKSKFRAVPLWAFFAEIFVIEKRLPDSPSRGVDKNAYRYNTFQTFK